jgi:hypothetical protein
VFHKNKKTEHDPLGFVRVKPWFIAMGVNSCGCVDITREEINSTKSRI